jgi:hypothetical protein
MPLLIMMFSYFISIEFLFASPCSPSSILIFILLSYPVMKFVNSELLYQMLWLQLSEVLLRVCLIYVEVFSFSQIVCIL